MHPLRVDVDGYFKGLSMDFENILSRAPVEVYKKYSSIFLIFKKIFFYDMDFY